MVTKTSSTGRESDKFMLRLPDGIRDRIAEAAKANNRTMNAELVARILQSFDEGIRSTASPMDGGLKLGKQTPPAGKQGADDALERIEWRLEYLARVLDNVGPKPPFALPPSAKNAEPPTAAKAPRASRKK